jgi:hypothetical protein
MTFRVQCISSLYHVWRYQEFCAESEGERDPSYARCMDGNCNHPNIALVLGRHMHSPALAP